MKVDDCPHCGRCKHCGRGDAQLPVYPGPYTNPWTSPWPIWPAVRPFDPWSDPWVGTPDPGITVKWSDWKTS